MAGEGFALESQPGRGRYPGHGTFDEGKGLSKKRALSPKGDDWLGFSEPHRPRRV
jgi:hypothetical protein